MLFDTKTFAFLGSTYQEKDTFDQVVIEVNTLTDTVPTAVADQARKFNLSLGRSGTPWAQPVTG